MTPDRPLDAIRSLFFVAVAAGLAACAACAAWLIAESLYFLTLW